MRATLTACLLCCLSPGLVAADEIIDSPMYKDPALPAPPIKTVLVDAKDLWLQALARPEAEYRGRAAEWCRAIMWAIGYDHTDVTPVLKKLRQEREQDG